jgi:hypothetical protein
LRICYKRMILICLRLSWVDFDCSNLFFCGSYLVARRC